MRKESEKIALAFQQRKPANARRTATCGDTVFLHGNKIAWRNADGSLSLTLAGWPTVTTRERLNAICEVFGYGRPFHQKRGQQYHNDTPISEHNTITYHPLVMADPEEWMRRNAA